MGSNKVELPLGTCTPYKPPYEDLHEPPSSITDALHSKTWILIPDILKLHYNEKVVLLIGTTWS